MPLRQQIDLVVLSSTSVSSQNFMDEVAFALRATRKSFQSFIRRARSHFEFNVYSILTTLDLTKTG